MTEHTPGDVPVRDDALRALAARDLDIRVVDTSDIPAFDAFNQVATRGLHFEELAGEQLEHRRAPRGDSERLLTVFDRASGQTAQPIATTRSWAMGLRIPDGALPMWSITSVTVAPSHRRRGIARVLLENEVRSAADAGYAVAGLTVSEATIYGRFGFGPAVPMTSVSIRARRAGWRGAIPTGRMEFISRQDAAADIGQVHARAFLRRPGEVAGWPGRWSDHAGVTGDEPRLKKRAARYIDAGGAVQGVIVYRVDQNGRGWADQTLEVIRLVAATDEAEVALYHFALNHDLVDEVKLELRPTDDIIRWLVADERAVVQTVRDHGWLRVLDVPRFFGARSYARDFDGVIDVADALEIAAGRYRLTVSDGRANITRSDDPADLSFDIADLSAASLGAVPITGLVAAGRVRGDSAAAARLDSALRTARAPAVSIWY